MKSFSTLGRQNHSKNEDEGGKEGMARPQTPAHDGALSSYTEIFLLSRGFGAHLPILYRLVLLRQVPHVGSPAP